MMETLKDIFLNLEDSMGRLISTYGMATYIILFAIIFVETGLVIMPFLPGDSLLFVAGGFCALNSLNIYYLILSLFAAAFLGDTLNYTIGRSIGERVLSEDFFVPSPNQGFFKTIFLKMIKRDHLLKAQLFYEKHGGKAIIIARFIPFARTFAPFIAGVGKMNYRKFISYNIIGAIMWIAGVTMIGYFFGNIPLVKRNFKVVIFLIILISIMPAIIEFLRQKYGKLNS